MEKSNLYKEIEKKNANKDQVVEIVLEQPDLIPELLAGLTEEKLSLKFGCEKILRLISEQNPELLYPYFDEIAALLDSDNKIMRWGAIITISNLTVTDDQKKFEKIFKKYYSAISGPDMIMAANIFKNAEKISNAKPQLTEKIAKEILRVESASFEKRGRPDPECNHVAYGHAIDALSALYGTIKGKKAVVRFVKKQGDSPRNSTARKAEEFEKKFGI
ncbi:hypothetical protein D3OALGB2SA_1722 [Olavius algarvensis associated proteobacterium Delta 3]|nr:hypothetical protein D3OALGB2SA_1722 [Olavius algarvensis associated proteobacterium Delta 3]